MGAAVAGSRKLAGLIEVEAIGEAVAAEDVVEHCKAGITCLLRREQPIERSAGGIVGREDQRELGQVRSEPEMRAAVEEEHGTELGLALAAATMVMTVVLFRTEAFGSEPGADRLAAEVDGKLLGQGFGEVGEVEVEALFAVNA